MYLCPFKPVDITFIYFYFVNLFYDFLHTLGLSIESQGQLYSLFSCLEVRYSFQYKKSRCTYFLKNLQYDLSLKPHFIQNYFSEKKSGRMWGWQAEKSNDTLIKLLRYSHCSMVGTQWPMRAEIQQTGHGLIKSRNFKGCHMIF